MFWACIFPALKPAISLIVRSNFFLCFKIQFIYWWVIYFVHFSVGFLVFFLLNLYEFFTYQRYEPIDCELHCKYFLQLSITFGFVCSFPQGKDLFCFRFYMATLINLLFMSPGFWVIENLSPHPGQRDIHPCVLVLVWFQFSLVDPWSDWFIFYMLWSTNLILSFSKCLTSCPSTFSKKSIYLFLGYFIPQVWLAYSSPSSDYHSNLLQMLYSVF